MECLKRLLCCIETQIKEEYGSRQSLQAPLINENDKMEVNVLEIRQKKIERVEEVLSEEKSNEETNAQHQSSPPETSYNLSDYQMCQVEYEEKQISYELGFAKKPYEKETAYLIKSIKHSILKETDLYYEIALNCIKNKLKKFKQSVFFYCMGVAGMNSWSRGRQFVQQLRKYPLYFVYFTIEATNNIRSRHFEVLPILGGPSSIRSLQQSKDWIILDYGQHGISDNLIRQNSPSCNKILSSVTEAFHRCNNIVVVFPWGVTKAEIFDLHLSILSELQDKKINFDIQLHSYRRQQNQTDLLIGFYGQGMKFKNMSQRKQIYIKCLLDLFDSMPKEYHRLYAVFDYFIQLKGTAQVLNMVCQMRKIDQNPQNIMAGFYSQLKQIAKNKGLMFQLQGDGFSVNIFDFEADISKCTKKIIQKKLIDQQGSNDGKDKDDYSYRQRFFKANRSRFFSNELHSDVSSNGDNGDDDFLTSKDSL